MSYEKGGIILAADLDGFLTTTNNVYGVGSSDRGYGQTAITQGSISAGSPILSTQWENLLSMIVVCANQQGTSTSTLPPSSVFDAGQPVIAEEQAPPSSRPYEMANNITAIDTNRLNVSDTSLSVTTNVWTVTRASTWTTSITAEVSVIWDSENSARYYFNSGGQIRLHGAQPGSSPADEHWNTTLTSGVGLVQFLVHSTTNTGSISGGTSLGYFELTDSYQTIYYANSGGGSYYDADNVTISAKRLNYVGLNGGNGNGVQFEIVLANSGSYYSGIIDSGTNFAFDNVIATTFLSGITSPVYTTITNF